MALTQGAWSVSTVNKRTVMTCTVAGTTSENDIYTLKTPTNLNPTLPWTVVAYLDEDMTGAGASTLDIWGGFSDSFAISGNDTTVAAAGTGMELFATTTDIDAGGTFAIRVIPGYTGTVTQVATFPGAICVLPPMPYYAFNIDMTAVLADAATVRFFVIQ